MIGRSYIRAFKPVLFRVQGLQTGVVSGQYVATPISGFLVCVAAVASVVEDSYKIRSGTYQEDRETDTSVT